MQEVIVEPAFGDKLGQLSGQAILCDSEGRVLGFFSPFRDRPKREELQLESPLTIEETEKLRQVRTGKPLEDILSRLGF